MRHRIASCPSRPKCVICTKDGITGARAAHVAASLGCPANKRKPVVEGRFRRGAGAPGQLNAD